MASNGDTTEACAPKAPTPVLDSDGGGGTRTQMNGNKSAFVGALPPLRRSARVNVSPAPDISRSDLDGFRRTNGHENCSLRPRSVLDQVFIH